MTSSTGLGGSPGIDAHTGDVVFTEQEMEKMLETAQSPPHPDDQPGYTPDGEQEMLDRLAMTAFLGLSQADKVTYLTTVTLEEAASALTWVDDSEQELLICSLPNQRQRDLLA